MASEHKSIQSSLIVDDGKFDIRPFEVNNFLTFDSSILVSPGAMMRVCCVTGEHTSGTHERATLANGSSSERFHGDTKLERMCMARLPSVILSSNSDPRVTSCNHNTRL